MLINLVQVVRPVHLEKLKTDNMKKIVFVILIALFTSGILYSQSKELTQHIKRTFGLNLSLSNIPSYDSCYYFTFLLKFEINNKSKVASIDASDNAEQWMKDEVNKVKAMDRVKKEIKRIDSLVKKDGLKNCALVFPIFILYDHVVGTDAVPCRPSITHNTWFIDEKLFRFNDKDLKGNIIFQSSIVFALWKPIP